MDDLSRKHVRAATRHMVSWLNQQGVHPAFGAELEYWLFKNGQKVQRDSNDIRQYQARVEELASQQGIRIAMQTFDAGVGQYELATAVADPATAGEWSIKLKQIFKQVAQEQGLEVNLKPKPSQDLYGSGFHVHMGIYDRDITGINQNVDGYSRRVNVSPPANQNLLLDSYGHRNGFAQSIVDGLSEVMEESQIVYFPSFNALKRNFGAQGSSYASKLLQASTTKGQYAIRIIDNGGATRYEARLAGMDADPDLVMASLVAGIVRGVERGRNLTYVSPFVTEQDFDRQHPPVVQRNGREREPAPHNGHVPSSIPLAGGLQVYQDDVPAKDFLSYCFLSADQLPRLLGKATHQRLSTGLMMNSSFFISPVNLQEYGQLGELRTTSSWDTINKVLQAQSKQIAPKFVKVSGDKPKKSLIFTFKDEAQRNNFIKRELGPYLLETLSLADAPFHGAMASDGSYTLGKKPDVEAGEQPCLVLDASKAAGYLEIYAKSHKSSMLRTELQRFEERKHPYTEWVPIQYRETTPAQRREASLIIDGATVQLERERRAREREQPRSAQQPVAPSREREPVFTAPAPLEPPQVATDQTLVAEIIRAHNWMQDGNGNYRINRNELNLTQLGRMQNDGMVLTDNYVFILSGSALHQHLNYAIRTRLVEEAEAQRLATEQGRIDPTEVSALYQELAGLPNWQRDQSGRYYRRLQDFSQPQIENMRRVNGDIIVSNQFAFVTQNTDLDRAITGNFRSQIEFLARNIDTILPRAVSEVQWQRDAQTNAWAAPATSIPEDIRQTLIADGNNVVQQEDGRLFVSQGSRLETMINEHGVEQAQGGQILEEAVRNPKWAKDGSGNYRIPRSELTDQQQGKVKNAGAVLSGNYLFVAPAAAAYAQITEATTQRLADERQAQQRAVEARRVGQSDLERLNQELAALPNWQRDQQNRYFRKRSEFNATQVDTMQRAAEAFVVSDNYIFVNTGTPLDRSITETFQAQVRSQPTNSNPKIAEGERIVRAAGYSSIVEYLAAQIPWDTSQNDVKESDLSGDKKKAFEALKAENPSLVGPNPGSQGWTQAKGSLLATVQLYRHAQAEATTQLSINQKEATRQETIRIGLEIAHASGYATVTEYVAAQIPWDTSQNDVKESELSGDKKKAFEALKAENSSLVGPNPGSQGWTQAKGALLTAIQHHRNAGNELQSQQQINQKEAKKQETIRVGLEIAHAAGYNTIIEYVAAQLPWDTTQNDLKESDLSGDKKKTFEALKAENPSLTGQNTQSQGWTQAKGKLLEAIKLHRNAGSELRTQQETNQKEAQRQETIRIGVEIARAAGYGTVTEYVAAQIPWDASQNDVKESDLSGDKKKAFEALKAENPSLTGSNNQSPGWTQAKGSLLEAIRTHRAAGAELTRQQEINRQEALRQAAISEGLRIANAAGYSSIMEYAATQIPWDTSQNDVKPEQLTNQQRKALDGLKAENASLLAPNPTSQGWTQAKGALLQTIQQHRVTPIMPNPSRVRGAPDIERGQRRDGQELE